MDFEKFQELLTSNQFKEIWTSFQEECENCTHSSIVEHIVRILRSGDVFLLKQIKHVFPNSYDTLYTKKQSVFPFVEQLFLFFPEKEQKRLIYHVFSLHIIDKMIQDDIYDFFSRIFPDILKDFPRFLFKIYAEDLKKKKFDPEFIFENTFFYSFNTLIEINHPLLTDRKVFKEEIKKLAALKNHALLLQLVVEHAFDLFSASEKNQLTRDYEIDEVIDTFLTLSEKRNVFNWIQPEYIVSEMPALGEFGAEFVLKLVCLEKDWYNIEHLDYEIEQEFTVFKNKLKEFFIQKKYSTIRNLFHLEVLTLLDKDDVLEIAHHPASNFYYKLDKALEEEYLSYLLPFFFKHLGTEYMPLYFKYLTKVESFYDDQLDILRELGKDFIPLFFKEYLINVHDYGYYYVLGDALKELFFSLFNSRQLKEFVLDKDMEFIKRLLKKHEKTGSINSYFLTQLYTRVDDFTIRSVHSILPEKVQEEVLAIVSEIFYNSFKKEEKEEMAKILTAVGDDSKVQESLEVLARYGFRMFQVVSEKIGQITLESPSTLLTLLGKTEILLNEHVDRESDEWLGLRPTKYPIEWILDELEYFLVAITHGFFSRDDLSWERNLIKFFKIVNESALLISKQMESYRDEDGAFQRFKKKDTLDRRTRDIIWNKRWHYFQRAFRNIVMRRDRGQTVMIEMEEGKTRYAFTLQEESLLKALENKDEKVRNLAVYSLKKHFPDYEDQTKRRIFASFSNQKKHVMKEMLLERLVDRDGQQRLQAAKDLSFLDKKYQGKTPMQIIKIMEPAKRKEYIEVLLHDLRFHSLTRDPNPLTKERRKLNLVLDLLEFEEEEVIETLEHESFKIERNQKDPGPFLGHLDPIIKVILDDTLERIRTSDKKNEIVKIKRLLNHLLDEDNRLRTDIVDELEKMGPTAIELLKLKFTDILYHIYHDGMEDFGYIVPYLIKYIPSEQLVEYLDNVYCLLNLVFDLEFTIITEITPPILDCYKKGPDTTCYHQAVSIIQKLNSHLLIPLAGAIFSDREVYRKEGIEVLSMVSSVEKEFIEQVVIKLVTTSNDVVDLFHHTSDYVRHSEYPYYESPLEDMKGLVEKLKVRVIKILDEEESTFKVKEMPEFRWDKRFKKGFIEALLFVLGSIPLKEEYDKQEIKEIFFNYFDRLVQT